ncbi:uncharacterized protein LOC119549613 [Drosophila subpulchrella]|uniref:uncharacterized protein LOC119549613 n=1 Tax=Drosophila subpulchrella TaxID=1486046 RepID=UPI0018A16C2A|nr:uncharacterized protein LOC119549613 [Drosophila subpulchrella]
MELLDPDLHSIDEVYAQFQVYKKRREREQQELDHKIKTRFNLDDDLKRLNSSLETMEAGLLELESRQSRQRKRTPQSSLDVIEPAPPGEAGSARLEEDPEPKPLLIKCGVSKCLFESCQRRVDSQLLLLHYLCDHDHKDASFQRCLPLLEGERVVLSLQPKTCQFRVNQVLGLLAYGGEIEHPFAMSRRPREIYNSFLPRQHSHLEAHIPLVVLICRTATHAALKNKAPKEYMRSPDSQKQDVFVFWLVTPSDRLQLNATLCLCGRDAAERVGTVVRVRQIIHSQDTEQFMRVDKDYWRLTYAEVEKLSNNFRDELQLEVSLTEAPAS